MTTMRGAAGQTNRFHRSMPYLPLLRQWADRLKGQIGVMPSTASAEPIQRISVSIPLSRASRPTSARYVSTVINQPLAPVLAHLRSMTNGTEGQSAEADPTLEVILRSRGRHVCVRYTVYAVPGGTQIEASIESLEHGRLDPMTGLAVRAMRGRTATELPTMRDILE